MKKTLLLLIFTAILSGCANQQLCADTAKTIAHSSSMAEIAKWNALQEIAKSGNETAKIVALQVIQAHRTPAATPVCKNF
jgi:predicted outer membrane protein